MSQKDTQDIIRLEKAFVRIIQRFEEMVTASKELGLLVGEINERVQRLEAAANDLAVLDGQIAELAERLFDIDGLTVDADPRTD